MRIGLIEDNKACARINTYRGKNLVSRDLKTTDGGR